MEKLQVVNDGLVEETFSDTGESRRMTTKEIKAIILTAKNAQGKWAALTVKERRGFLQKILPTLVERIDDIASTVSESNGKTRFDAMATEIVPSTMALAYYLRNAKKWLKERRLGSGNIFFMNKQSKIRRVPYGVIGIITPWNYPFSIPFSEVIMGLLAGNCVILKTAEETSEVGLLIKTIIESAGLPEGVFNFVECDGPTTSKVLLENGIDKLFFTGSVRVGKHLMAKASETLTPVNLELGGNDAMIVCADANIERAAAGAVWAGFQNAGQSCGGVERIYVHETIFNRFVTLLSEKTEKLRVGTDTDFNIDIGQMTTDRQVDTVSEHLADALRKGAVVMAEGLPPSNMDKGCRLVTPKVLVDVNHDMLVMKEETFGPVVGVMKYASESEAVSMANDSDLGLTASVWTTDRKQGTRIAEQIQAGAVTINDHLMSHGLSETPWGGFKQSGVGRSHGAVGFAEMTQPQVIVRDYFSFLPKNLWWFPAGKKVYEGLRGIPVLLYGGSVKRRLGGLVKLLIVLPRVLMKR